MNSSRLLRGVLLLTALPALCSAQGVVRSRAELQRGTALLARGMGDSALATYRRALLWARADTAATGELAEAYFGIATAKGLIPGAATERDRIDEYLNAATLAPELLFVAAVNNAAQVARQRGDHAESARLFTAAAEREHAARSYILLDAGTEWLAAERTDSAFVSFERAVRVDPNNSAAAAALADLALARAPERVLELAAATRAADASTQMIVVRALAELLAQGATNTRVFDAALTLLVPALSRAGVGPDVFALRLRARLAGAVERRDHAGVFHLLQAYADPPQATDPPAWWRDDVERLSVWTRAMTALGVWREARGDFEAARRYYECALVFPHVPITEPWVDVGAMVPLARIYSVLSGLEFRRFVSWAFDEKRFAYELLWSGAPRAVPIVRELHLTLGLMFATRGQWGGSVNDVQGAAYQLSQMREFTERMQADGIDVSDPPELLEQLVYAYWATGREGEVRELVPAVVNGYRERGLVSQANRFRIVAGRPELLSRAVRREPGE